MNGLDGSELVRQLSDGLCAELGTQIKPSEVTATLAGQRLSCVAAKKLFKLANNEVSLNFADERLEFDVALDCLVTHLVKPFAVIFQLAWQPIERLEGGEARLLARSKLR